MQNMQNIQNIGIIGAGQMGAGIAQVAAQAGFDVICSDISEESLEKGRASVAYSLYRLLKKERITAVEKEQIVARIIWTTEIEAHHDRDLVIEAVSENENLKDTIFRTLEDVCSENCILASNTSSISITRLAGKTKHPERFMGMHFMNPVPIMKLVELIRGLQTSEVCYQAVKAVAEKMGKTVSASADYPGFIANRILMPMINEAFYALMEGVGTAEDIDTTMKLGTNQPMGPLALADFIGLDTCLAIMNVLHEGMADTKYRPCPLLRQYVDAGWLGKKLGRGVYGYDK